MENKKNAYNEVQQVYLMEVAKDYDALSNNIKKMVLDPVHINFESEFMKEALKELNSFLKEVFRVKDALREIKDTIKNKDYIGGN